MNNKFIPGLELSELYFQKEVKPIFDKKFPNLEYSAGLIGWGSEVLGYDTPISRDHHWGPRVLIFLNEENFLTNKEEIGKVLSENLPYSFQGYSTNFSDAKDKGVRHPVDIATGPVNHMVDFFTVKSFFEMRLDFNPFQTISVIDWLTFPQQRLLEIVSGKVFHDGLGELNKVIDKFRFYPHDIWLYLMASQWTKISQEEAFVGRCGDVGDELGSQIVSSRIVRELMKLCFLLDKKYVPYSKWFGTGFSRLKCSSTLSPIFRKVLLSQSWKEREKYLSEAYEMVAELHNLQNITEPLSTKVSEYYGRPYLVIHADRFAESLKSKITDVDVKSIENNFGSVDQFIDSTDILSMPEVLKKIRIWHKD